jgi:hypothetical protein
LPPLSASPHTPHHSIYTQSLTQTQYHLPPH